MGVVFDPQYGPMTIQQVEHLIRPAGRKYDHLVLAGFSFDANVQDHVLKVKHPKSTLHLAHIRPDVNPAMTGLLKQQSKQQLFTVFGQPRTKVTKRTDGEYEVEMRGVDIYNPAKDAIESTGSTKVAAWFVDTDYNGELFSISQAYFPNRDAWEKIAKALKLPDGSERFEALEGTVSKPFPLGIHKRVAVKVIDPRGNEVLRVHEVG